MYRAAYCNVYINQRDAQILVNSLYFFTKWLYICGTNDSHKRVGPFNEKNKDYSQEFVHIVGLYTHFLRYLQSIFPRPDSIDVGFIFI
jgi:hypothetical protein